MTVFRRSDAIPDGENERLPAIGRRIGENPDLLLLEDAPRHSLCAVLMTRRLNLVLKTVNLTLRKFILTVLGDGDLIVGGVKK